MWIVTQIMHILSKTIDFCQNFATLNSVTTSTHTSIKHRGSFVKDSGKLDKMTENKGASRNSFKDKEKPVEVRLSNIIAAKGTLNIITAAI